MIFLLKLSLSVVAPLAIYSYLASFQQLQQVEADASHRFSRPIEFHSIADAERELQVDARVCDDLDRHAYSD